MSTWAISSDTDQLDCLKEVLFEASEWSGKSIRKRQSDQNPSVQSLLQAKFLVLKHSAYESVHFSYLFL